MLYPELARSNIVASLTGPLAEIRVSGTVDFMGSLNDITEAADTAEMLSGDRGAFALGRECQREASAMVERDWPTIVAVAEARRNAHRSSGRRAPSREYPSRG